MDECVMCRASCPSKSVHKEPDTGIPFKCDFCGEPPDPQCPVVRPWPDVLLFQVGHYMLHGSFAGVFAVHLDDLPHALI